MKILVFDNYDSFTYNLVHIIRALGYGAQTDVFRNDAIPLDQVAGYDKVLLSPGPGVPAEAGQLLPLIARYGAEKSILGVCLGHQAIGEAYGARLFNLPAVLHGESLPTLVTAPDDYLFAQVPERFPAGRYHSWVVDRTSIPEALEVTATDERGEVMALRHRHHDVRGVQFHPESILTGPGARLIQNWLEA